MSTEPHNTALDDIPGFHSLIIHCRENLMSHILSIDFLYRITKKNTENIRINVILRRVRVTTFVVKKQ